MLVALSALQLMAEQYASDTSRRDRGIVGHAVQQKVNGGIVIISAGPRRTGGSQQACDDLPIRLIRSKRRGKILLQIFAAGGSIGRAAATAQKGLHQYPRPVVGEFIGECFFREQTTDELFAAACALVVGQCFELIGCRRTTQDTRKGSL